MHCIEEKNLGYFSSICLGKASQSFPFLLLLGNRYILLSTAGKNAECSTMVENPTVSKRFHMQTAITFLEIYSKHIPWKR